MMKNINSFKTLLKDEDIIYSFKEKVNGDIVMEQYRTFTVMDSFKEKNKDFLIMDSYKEHIRKESITAHLFDEIIETCSCLKKEKNPKLLEKLLLTVESLTTNLRNES